MEEESSNVTKTAIFTSHGQLQREAGVPGIYLDIPDIEPRKTTLGRPTKKLMALFKSQRLREFAWFIPTHEPEVAKVAVPDTPALPFVCEQCGGTWKNYEGILYHKTKSKSACNPNYRHIEGSAKRRKKAHMQSDADDAAWLKSLYDDNGIQQQTDNAKNGASKGSSLNAQNSKVLMLDMLDANKGVLPADGSIWLLFGAAWEKMFPQLHLPLPEDCESAVGRLSDNGAIQKVVFTFRDKTGLMATRSILIKNGIDPLSAAAAQLKDDIKTVHPDLYLPAELAPSEELRAQLEAAAKEGETRKSTSTPLKTTRSGRTVKAPTSVQIANALASMDVDDDLDFNDEEEPFYEDFDTPSGARRVRQKYSRPSQYQRLMKTRRQIALPIDLEGAMIPPDTDDPDFQVEVAYNHHRNTGARKRTILGALEPTLENRIILAVVVVRSLVGGLDRSVDWVLVSGLFPEHPMNFVSKAWLEIQPKHSKTIERLNIEFQSWFLEAYEAGEVPPINYDKLVDYDWETLIDHAAAHLRMDVGMEATSLPAKRSVLEHTYTIKESGEPRIWRDDFFGLYKPVYKRMEDASNEPWAPPIDSPPTPLPKMDRLQIAKSWVRANIITPNESYDPSFAEQKLKTLPSGQVKVAMDELLASKVLMLRNRGRAAPGRGCEITDTFAAAFRTHLDEKQLSQAVRYKTYLDEAFRTGQPVFVEWTADEGAVLATTNLQAHGRVRLEPRNLPSDKFGLGGYGYQTKKIGKDKLRFQMEILSTDTYIPNGEIDSLLKHTPSAGGVGPPKGEAGALPLWYDIADNLLPAMWKKVACAVLATMAFRPGMDVKEIVRLFSPALWEWEVRSLVNWFEEVDAITRLREGHEGWNVGEWWWYVGGGMEGHGALQGSVD